MNKATTRVGIFTYPDWQCTVQLTTWLHSHFKMEHIFSNCVSPLIVARNQAIRNTLKEHYTDFLFVDKDMVPDASTNPFLEAEGDVVCVRTDLRSRAAWSQPNAFHCGMFRISAEALHKLTPPWFMFKYSLDGCKIEACECTFFRDKCEAAGLTVANAGYCQHHKPPTDTWHKGG